MHPSPHNPMTQVLHQRASIDGANPSVTPIFQNSAFASDSPYFYTRKNNPNSQELEDCLALIEDAKHCLTCTTGMTALHLSLALLKPQQHLVINSMIYGCSYKLFQRHCEKISARLSICDLSTDDGIAAMPTDADMIIFETPTNPFLKTISIKKVSARAHHNNAKALVIVDNTWATAYHQQPLKHGADISLASATKFISGHSDVMGGIICCNNAVLADTLRQERFYSGSILDPHSAWLLRRSLQTFELRMREHVLITQQMVAFLTTRAEIEHIFQPEIDGEELSNYGGIVFIQLTEAYHDAFQTLAHHLNLFGTGTGMACVTSMIAQPYHGSHASMTDGEKRRMGINPGLVRLCFGFERSEDLIADLNQAFDQLTPSHLDHKDHESLLTH